jgi:2-polyprenyl-3-methyl-5-hydroxy-6-metoxy-1,4-benzoquinol methylase
MPERARETHAPVDRTAARVELWAEAPTPARLEECSFYQSIELPGLGLQQGEWDLREGYDDYFGSHEFSGERVLDLGTANGALAFEMERRGAAEVVAFDLDEGLTYDCRLPANEETLADQRAGLARIRNAFWLAHHALGSKVKVVYGHAGDLPAELGYFDTVMMGNILQHLQDPVGAVLQAIRHTDHLIVTEADWMRGSVGDDFVGLVMFDLPNPFSWYQVKPGLLQNLLGRWGFSEQRLSWHWQQFLETDSRVPHFTLALRRPSAVA